MVFKLNETAGGFKHLGLKLQRILFRQRRDRYMSRFAPLAAEPARRFDGSVRLCHHCGYQMMAIKLAEDWSMETCSAMPILLLSSPQFAAWKETVPAEKMTASCV